MSTRHVNALRFTVAVVSYLLKIWACNGLLLQLCISDKHLNLSFSRETVSVINLNHLKSVILGK